MDNICKNCHEPVSQKYCGNCGMALQLPRINGHYISHEIQHVLHFEKGILYTIRELITNPGHNVRQFISENRSRLVKPVVFLLVTSVIYTIVSKIFHLEEGQNEAIAAQSGSTGMLMKWVQEHYGYANLLMGVFIALWLKVFFRKHQYNFFEVLILLCFVMGMGMLFYAVYGLVQGLTGLGLMTAAYLISILYFGWAIGQFYDKSRFLSYVKAMAAYLLGMVSFFLFVSIVGAIADRVLH